MRTGQGIHLNLFLPIGDVLGNPDYVVDCIGDLSSKLDLLKYCFDNKIPVMSSMGAGTKADPSRVQISDISETFGKSPPFSCLVSWSAVVCLIEPTERLLKMAHNFFYLPYRGSIGKSSASQTEEIGS